MIAVQLALDDCEPDWTEPHRQPGDDKPTPIDLRIAEIRDLRDQGPGPVALWTADTVPTGRYL